jgi:hypothetical protein
MLVRFNHAVSLESGNAEGLFPSCGRAGIFEERSEVSRSSTAAGEINERPFGCPRSQDESHQAGHLAHGRELTRYSGWNANVSGADTRCAPDGPIPGTDADG